MLLSGFVLNGPLFFLQFGTHDVVVLKPNKADLGSPALGQGVVYRLKVVHFPLKNNSIFVYYSRF